MTIEVVRSGGFAGRVLRWGVSLQDLPPETADELTSLVRGAGSWPADPVGADRFSWRVVTSTDVDVALTEPLPAPAERLIALVRDQAGPG